jgi:transposase-like protein
MRNTSALWNQESEEECSQANLLLSYISLRNPWNSQGKTLEFLLSPTRDAEAAKSFFLKALPSSARSASQGSSMHETETPSLPVSLSAPRVINVDKNAASPKARVDLKATGMFPERGELRHVKYLNNLIEQDHRAHQTAGQSRYGFLLV